MSLALLNIVSKLTENKQVATSDKHFSDIIHGRIDVPLFSDSGELPVVPEKESKWVSYTGEHGETLERRYNFANIKTLLYFINESLKYQDSINHHAMMTIDELVVDIILQTKDVSLVTELDLDLSRVLDEIFQDTQFFYPIDQE
jgi:pterin-4a-carbinolamine dehydratase